MDTIQFNEILKQFDNDFLRIQFDVDYSQYGINEEISVAFLTPPPFAPNSSSFENDTSLSKSSFQFTMIEQEEQDNRQYEIMDEMEDAEDAWLYKMGPRYIAIRSSDSPGGVSVFRVNRLTDKALLIDIDLWIPFSVIELCISELPFCQSGAVDFSIILPQWFIHKNDTLANELSKPKVKDDLLLNDLLNSEDFCNCVIDAYAYLNGEIPNTSEFKEARKVIREFISEQQHDAFGQEAIFQAAKIRQIPFPHLFSRCI